MFADLLLLVGVKGTGEVKAFNDEVDRTTKSARRAGKALDDFGNESTRAARKTKRFAAVGLQQLGYQVGDFAVQVQGGTNAFVAFGQQGSQMLGILGPLGAVAGALLAIFTAFAAAMSESEDATGRAAAEFAKLRGEFEPLLTITKNLLNTLKEMAFDTLNVLANNLQLVISYAAAATLVWGGKAGLTAAITLATLAVRNFGKVVRTVLVGTVVGIAIVALGQLINMILELREATKSWGETFALVADVITGFTADLPNRFANAWLGLVKRLGDGFANGMDLFASFVEALEGGVERTQAVFDVAFQAISNIVIKAMHSMSEEVDKVFDAVLAKAEGLLRVASHLPGLMGRGFGVAAETAAGLQNLGPGTAQIGETTFEEFLARRLGTMSLGSGTIREGAEGMRAAAKGLFDLLERDTTKGTEAFNKLKEALDSVGVSVSDFDVRNLVGGLASVADAATGAGADGKPSVRGAFHDLTKEMDEFKNRVAKDFATTIVGSFRSIVNGTKTVSQAFREMAISVIQQIMDILIWQPLINSLTSGISGMLGSAMGPTGNGFLGQLLGFGLSAATGGSGGSTRGSYMFANGGVVGSPTYFGLANGGMGVMGEAGPEAILPLKRGANGKLGVEGGGNVTVNQTFQFAANGDDSVKRIIAEAAPQIAKMTEAQIINSRQRGGQMRRAFG